MATIVTNIPFTVREALKQIKDTGYQYPGPMTNDCVQAVLELLLEGLPKDPTNPPEPRVYHGLDGAFWVDTGHGDVGPFDSSVDADAHRNRIISDKVRLLALIEEKK